MSFIKRGDGKIVSVIDEEELTDNQKKKAKDLSKKIDKNSETDPSTNNVVKKSGS